MAIYAIVTISATFVNFFVHPAVKLFWLLVLVISSEAAVFIFSRTAYESILMVLFHRGVVRPMPLEVKNLAQRMGVELKKFKIADNFRNAYTNGSNVVIGQTLLDELTREEILAVIAHELAHIKENHILIRIVAFIPIYFIATMSFQGLPYIFQGVAVLAYVIVVLTPLNWYLEIRADRLAGHYVGSDTMKSTLIVIHKGLDRKDASETHPPIGKRISSLDKGGNG
jgi:Zn-dependent protease with chaperone function